MSYLYTNEVLANTLYSQMRSKHSTHYNLSKHSDYELIILSQYLVTYIYMIYF